MTRRAANPAVPAEVPRNDIERPAQQRRRRRVLLLAVPADLAHEPLGEHAEQRGRPDAGVDAEVSEPRDGAEGVVGVQRADDQVPSLGRSEGQLRRLGVADLAEHDDLGVVAQERAGVGREGVPHALVHFVLGELRADVLDRVLGGHDLEFRPVDRLHDGEQARALAGARRAGHEDRARRRPDQLLQPLGHRTRQLQRGQRVGGAARVENADDRILAVIAGNDGHAEVHRDDAAVDLHAGAEAAVLRAPALGDIEGCEDLDA